MDEQRQREALEMEMAPPEIPETTVADVDKISNWKVIFLIFRSLVGIGVLSMPITVQRFGVVGALVFAPIFTVSILYSLELIVKIAEDVGYDGPLIEELIEKTGNGKYKHIFSLANNLMMFCGSIVNCIFACNFD